MAFSMSRPVSKINMINISQSIENLKNCKHGQFLKHNYKNFEYICILLNFNNSNIEFRCMIMF